MRAQRATLVPVGTREARSLPNPGEPRLVLSNGRRPRLSKDQQRRSLHLGPRAARAPPLPNGAPPLAQQVPQLQSRPALPPSQCRVRGSSAECAKSTEWCRGLTTRRDATTLTAQPKYIRPNAQYLARAMEGARAPSVQITSLSMFAVTILAALWRSPSTRMRTARMPTGVRFRRTTPTVRSRRGRGRAKSDHLTPPRARTRTPRSRMCWWEQQRWTRAEPRRCRWGLGRPGPYRIRRASSLPRPVLSAPPPDSASLQECRPFVPVCQSVRRHTRLPRRRLEVLPLSLWEVHQGHKESSQNQGAHGHR